jgi:hypothetical protein
MPETTTDEGYEPFIAAEGWREDASIRYVPESAVAEAYQAADARGLSLTKADCQAMLAAAAPVIAAQAAAAERERIRQLAIRVEAEYSDGDDGEICCDDDCHLIWKPFADLIGGHA